MLYTGIWLQPYTAIPTLLCSLFGVCVTCGLEVLGLLAAQPEVSGQHVAWPQGPEQQAAQLEP